MTTTTQSGRMTRPIDTTGLTGGTGCWLRSRGREVPIRDGVGGPMKRVTSARPVWFKNLTGAQFEKDPEIFEAKLPRPAEDEDDLEAIVPPKPPPKPEVKVSAPPSERTAEAIADLVAEVEELRAKLSSAVPDDSITQVLAEVQYLRGQLAERDEVIAGLTAKIEEIAAPAKKAKG